VVAAISNLLYFCLNVEILFIYIYFSREREREAETDRQMNPKRLKYMYIYSHTAIGTYICLCSPFEFIVYKYEGI